MHVGVVGFAKLRLGAQDVAEERLRCTVEVVDDHEGRDLDEVGHGRFSCEIVCVVRPGLRMRSRKSWWTRGSALSSGWKVAARRWPSRTRTGKPSRVARVSTLGPVRVMRGARMKTISSGPPASVGRGGEDGGVDLAAVGVALDGDVEGGEGFLRGVLDVLGEEDGAGAGAEGGGGLDEGLEGVEEAVALEEFEEGGGFAAGDDEAVEIGEFGWSADELCGDAEGSERFGVGFECALQGEDADGEWVYGTCCSI